MIASSPTNNIPSQQNQKQSTENLNRLLSIGLLVCVSFSLCVVTAGLILLCTTGNGNIQPLVRLNQIPSAITINWGILALILTPAIQIIIASAKFFLDKDKVFASISLSILIFLGICFVLALI